MQNRSIPWFACFAIWFAVLWWLSSQAPDVPRPLRFTFGDKILHFGYFLIGAWILATALHLWKRHWTSRRLLLTATVSVALVGVIDEFHQSFVPGRQGNDPWDFAADVLGAIAGSWVSLRRGRRFGSRQVRTTPQLPRDPSVAPPRGIPKSAIACMIISVLVAAVFISGSAKVFHIPSGGMAPTLQPGDYVFVTRSLRNAEDLQAGEIVVFRPPTNRESRFIQRIVAKAGDRVELIDGRLAVNGTLLTSPAGSVSRPGDPQMVRQHLKMKPVAYPFVVKPGEVFLMGDNFENSLDSRYFGPVSTDSITHQPHGIIHPLPRTGKLD